MEKRNKNIVIVTHYYTPHIGGIEIVAHNQAKQLVAEGHTVTVITSKLAFDKTKYSIDGVSIVRVKAYNIFEKWGIPFPIFSPKLWFVLSKIVRNADVVHVHDAFYMSSFFAVLSAKLYKKPIVLTQHIAFVSHPTKIVNLIQRIVYRTTGALIFSFSNTIITYNGRVKYFLKIQGVPERKIIFLVNAVDTQLFKPISIHEKAELRRKFGLNSDEKILLFVGRFVHKKGFSAVLDARSDKYKILCVGGETPREKFENIIFLGKVDQKQLSEIYQIADIFILPSEGEGFPLSIQEAMASGLPVITMKDIGYAEYGLDEKTVYFIEAPVEKSLKLAISSIVSNDELLKEMALYSVGYAQSKFDWSSVVSQLNKIYDSLLQNKKQSIIKKKIAIVSDAVYPFNKGGKEKRIHDLTNRLSKKGYEVTLYCMKWWEGERIIKKDGVTFYAISPYYTLYSGNRRSIKEAIFFALHCFKLITKSFDIIEIDHMPHLVLFTTKIICVLKRKTMIVTWHEVWGKEYWKKYLGLAGIFAYWIEKVSSHLPDLIISVSEQTTRGLRDILKTKKIIVTIPNGLDLEEIKKLTPSIIGSDVIFAGRLLVNKNVDVLLRAISILSKQNPNISLCIIGEGPERMKLEGLVEELGIKNNVIFQNFFENHDDLYRALLASKVFVLPSTREGFGIVALEANASGLPIVTIDHPENAARDLVVDGKNGILTPLNEDEMAEAIKKSFELKKKTSDYVTYIKKYDWNSIISNVVTVYESVGSKI